jgi:ribosomal RNA-processing protein 8
VSSSVAIEMDNAGVKLTKGQKKKLKLKGKREAEAALISGSQQSSKQEKKDGKPPPQGSSQASRKRPAPDSAVAASSGGSGVGAGGGVSGAAVPKKQRSKADESLAMQRRSKSYAFQAEPASNKGLKKPKQAHTLLAQPSPATAGATVSGGAAAPSKGGGSVLSGGSKSLTSLQERMRAKLEGAKFRMINEELYTTTGSDALKRYQADPTLFEIYHRGYREQVAKWPENPLTAILAWLATRPCAPGGIVVADFGCGDAVLARDAPPTVATCHSFDLVAVNPRVVACNMAHVPLADACVDVCVFCLSLMGTNLADYLREAKRVLKQPGGLLKVCVYVRKRGL